MAEPGPWKQGGTMWPRIILLWLCGVLAAAMLGKMAALSPLLARELALPLAAAATLVSMVDGAGALFGAASGTLAARLGQGRTLALGLGLIAAAGLAEAWAPGRAALFAARAVEALGYLAVVVSAPVLVAAAAPPGRRAGAMAFWGSFVPVGLMLGAAISGGAAEWLPWRWVLAGWSLAALALLAAVAAAGRAAPFAERFAPEAGPGRGAVTPEGPPLRRGRVWLLAAGFGAYAVFEIGMLALLPEFLTARLGAEVGFAGAAAGAASVAAIAGIAAVGLGAARRPRLATAAGLAPSAAMTAALFAAPPGLAGATALAIGANAFSGAFAGLAFAAMPGLAGPRGFAFANGLMTQFGASGAFLGPPLYAGAVALGGWPAAGAFGAAACLAGLALALAALRRG